MVSALHDLKFVDADLTATSGCGSMDSLQKPSRFCVHCLLLSQAMEEFTTKVLALKTAANAVRRGYF